MKIPELDLSQCNQCLSCVELSRQTFHLCAAGYIEILDQDSYPEDLVDQAISICPGDCISWKELQSPAVD